MSAIWRISFLKGYISLYPSSLCHCFLITSKYADFGRPYCTICTEEIFFHQDICVCSDSLLVNMGTRRCIWIYASVQTELYPSTLSSSAVSQYNRVRFVRWLVWHKFFVSIRAYGWRVEFSATNHKSNQYHWKEGWLTLGYYVPFNWVVAWFAWLCALKSCQKIQNRNGWLPALHLFLQIEHYGNNVAGWVVWM